MGRGRVHSREFTLSVVRQVASGETRLHSGLGDVPPAAFAAVRLGVGQD